jgi:PAS domain S-box-containing protein
VFSQPLSRHLCSLFNWSLFAQRQSFIMGAEKTQPEDHVSSVNDDLLETVRRSEGRFRLAFDNAPIGMAIVGMNYRLRRVNPALSEALGYSQRELLERTFVDITHPDDQKKDKALATQLFRGEIPSYRLEKRFIRKDGQLIWLDLTALLMRDRENKPIYGLVMVEDITERKRAEEALRTSEERYRSFVVNSSEGIWRLEIERPIDTELTADEQLEMLQKFAYLAESNDALARMHGHERAEDLIGLRPGDLFAASHQINFASARAFIENGYRMLNLETIEVDSEGRKKYFTNNVIGIAVNGYLLRVWGTQRDETEHKLAEEEIKRSRKQMRALAAHLQTVREKERADISREIHDVLGQGLIGLKIEISRLTRMLPESESESVRDSMSERLRDVTRLLDENITAVKNLSTELRPRVLDMLGLSAALEWQCQEFERRTRISCSCQLPNDDIQFGEQQSTALFRIAQEALTNVARHALARHVIVELNVIDAGARLIVRDDGKGLAEGEASAPGSLGLLGMRERAEMLGGKLTIDGGPGRGTVVCASVPLKTSAPL